MSIYRSKYELCNFGEMQTHRLRRDTSKRGADRPRHRPRLSMDAGASMTLQQPPVNTQGDDGFARCELLVPKAAAAPVKGRKKDAEPTRRLREAMGLCRKQRQTGALGIGESREVRGSGHAPPPCMPSAGQLIGLG